MQSTGRAPAKPQRQRESPASQPGEIRPESGRLIPSIFAFSSYVLLNGRGQP